MNDSRRVLMVSPPWRTPLAADLALATLRPVLAAEGIESDALHGSLLFPVPGVVRRAPARERAVGDYLVLVGYCSTYAFAHCLFPELDPDASMAALLCEHERQQSLGGLREVSPRQADGMRRAVRQAFPDTVERARACVDRCAGVAAQPRYDVVLFSATFEEQLAGALAIARRLKAQRPDLRIALGGAACLGEAPEALIASFLELDAVCGTEGERVIAPLVRALRGEGSLCAVPGIVCRDEDGKPWRTDSPPLLTDLDTLPLPELDDYFAEYASSPWASGPPQLYFETSRGCWWGQKHPCTFCGLNPAGLTYRRKSAERAFREIRALYLRYPLAKGLQATDNILDMGYLESVLPRLAEMPQDPDRPLRLFFETKANLRREHVETLARAGLDLFQPGVESLSDGILDLMNKGATGLGQVQLIKWACELDIGVSYNLLIGNPGEKAEHYREMADLLPYILHLMPPEQVMQMTLQPSSAYHLAPERFGIRNVRPAPAYHAIYPEGFVDLRRIAVRFDFDHDMFEDAALRIAQCELVDAVFAWLGGYGEHVAVYRAGAGCLYVHESRAGQSRVGTINGLASRVYGYVDRHRPLAGVRRRFADELDPVVLDCLLCTWRHRRWAYVDGRGRVLAVLVRHAASSEEVA